MPLEMMSTIYSDLEEVKDYKPEETKEQKEKKKALNQPKKFGLGSFSKFVLSAFILEKPKVENIIEPELHNII
jgi:hypothetical protein